MLKWTGKYRDQRAGKFRVFFSAGYWTLHASGKLVSRHDSRDAAKRKAAKLVGAATPATPVKKRKPRAKPCQHKTLVYTWHTGGDGVERVLSRQCSPTFGCGTLVPFREPSDEAPVAVEIRAAEIAAGGMGPDEVADDEMAGRIIAHFDDRFAPSSRHEPSVLAGFLSAVIEEDEIADRGWPWDPTRPLAEQDVDAAWPARGESSSGRTSDEIGAARHGNHAEEQSAATETETAARNKLTMCPGCEAPFGCPDGECYLAREAERTALPDEPPEETERAHARIEGAIAKIDGES